MEAEALVVEEEESLIFAVVQVRNKNRPPGGKAKIILSVGRLGSQGLPRSLVKAVLSVECPSVGVESPVAEEIVNRAVELVGSGLHGQVDNAIPGFAELGSKIALQHFEFLH